MPATTYLTPGVYVEEEPSAYKPIAGASTSTACFLGIVPDTLQIPEENPDYDPTGKSPDPKTKKSFVLKTFKFYSKDEKKAKVDAVNKAKAAFEANADPTRARDLAKAVRQALDDEAQAEWPADNATPVLCSSFTDFTKRFGGFSTDGLGESSADLGAHPPTAGFQNRLAHAVFGFFDNGGTNCYVMRFKTAAELLDPESLEPLKSIDDISLVAAPGISDKNVQENIVDHCEGVPYRFAILDPPELAPAAQLTEDNLKVVDNSDYAALYFPRILVFDKAAELTRPELDHPEMAEEVNKGEIWMGPSGHIAGVYARVDQTRGVWKAPANEVIRGARDLEFQVTKAQQELLNPHGVNVIRYINEGKRIWGAQTVGGQANEDLKYINVRRTLLFLEESLDNGTQWVVFEPNDPELWSRIVRDVSAFLTIQWRAGALFGTTPQEAFYVKCDVETNPVEERELGKVTTEIGVAIVRPAEFVIFRISQWTGPEST